MLSRALGARLRRAGPGAVLLRRLDHGARRALRVLPGQVPPVLAAVRGGQRARAARGGERITIINTTTVPTIIILITTIIANISMITTVIIVILIITPTITIISIVITRPDPNGRCNTNPTRPDQASLDSTQQ